MPVILTIECPVSEIWGTSKSAQYSEHGYSSTSFTTILISSSATGASNTNRRTTSTTESTTFFSDSFYEQGRSTIQTTEQSSIFVSQHSHTWSTISPSATRTISGSGDSYLSRRSWSSSYWQRTTSPYGSSLISGSTSFSSSQFSYTESLRTYATSGADTVSTTLNGSTTPSNSTSASTNTASAVSLLVNTATTTATTVTGRGTASTVASYTVPVSTTTLVAGSTVVSTTSSQFTKSIHRTTATQNVNTTSKITGPTSLSLNTTKSIVRPESHEWLWSITGTLKGELASVNASTAEEFFSPTSYGASALPVIHSSQASSSYTPFTSALTVSRSFTNSNASYNASATLEYGASTSSIPATGRTTSSLFVKGTYSTTYGDTTDISLSGSATAQYLTVVISTTFGATTTSSACLGGNAGDRIMEISDSATQQRTITRSFTYSRTLSTLFVTSNSSQSRGSTSSFVITTTRGSLGFSDNPFGFTGSAGTNAIVNNAIMSPDPSMDASKAGTKITSPVSLMAPAWSSVYNKVLCPVWSTVYTVGTLVFNYTQKGASVTQVQGTETITAALSGSGTFPKMVVSVQSSIIPGGGPFIPIAASYSMEYPYRRTEIVGTSFSSNQGQSAETIVATNAVHVIERQLFLNSTATAAGQINTYYAVTAWDSTD